MKKLLAILFCAAGLFNIVHAQEIDKLAWMTGTWTQSKDGEVVQESWLGPRGKMMAAVNLTSSPKRNSFEFLRIVEKDGALSYLASPGGRAPTEFKLKEMSEKKVVFENPAHDFPQRVIYAREGSQLNARVEDAAGANEVPVRSMLASPLALPFM